MWVWVWVCGCVITRVCNHLCRRLCTHVSNESYIAIDFFPLAALDCAEQMLTGLDLGDFHFRSDPMCSFMTCFVSTASIKVCAEKDEWA